jgi:hypothetical protein
VSRGRGRVARISGARGPRWGSSAATVLSHERDPPGARRAQQAAPIDLVAVRREIDVMVRDLRGLLEGGAGREVLKRLLGEERLRIRPDPERESAVEGEFAWLVGTCRDSVVAGTGFEPVTFGL